MQGYPVLASIPHHPGLAGPSTHSRLAGVDGPATRDYGDHRKEPPEKPRVVVLSKSDLLPPQERSGAPARVGLSQALVLSAHSGEGLKELLEALWVRIAAATEVQGESHDG